MLSLTVDYVLAQCSPSLPFSKNPNSDRFFQNRPGFGTTSLEGEGKEYCVPHGIDGRMSSQGMWDMFFGNS